MNDKFSYPDTAEKRRAGMARVRAIMLAAHKRQLESGRWRGANAEQIRDMISVIEATQKRLDPATNWPMR